MTGATDDGSGLDPDRRAALITISRTIGAALGAVCGALAGTAAAAADLPLDIQMLQTASSLETLLVDLYGAALGTGPLGKNAPSAVALAAMTDVGARDTLTKLLTDTQAHHREHRLAFQALTVALGGKEQKDPNPKYASGVAGADLSSPERLVDYAAVLEKIAADTYVTDLISAQNVKAKETLASVMAIESQHLAVFRAIGALLRAGTPNLVRVPLGNALVDLPATLAAIAFPDAIADLDSASVAEPGSGAVP